VTVGVSLDQSSEVLRLKERHAPTWDGFFDRMYPRLIAYAERRLGNREDARDVVSETFVRLIQGLPALDRPEVTPEGWCFGILHHVVADTHRRRAVRQQAAVPDLAPSHDPADAAVLTDEHSGLRKAFDRLSPRDRDLLELRVVAGLSAEEVATIVSMRPGAVRMAQHRALERLRALFEDDGDDR
jgi:RNA polymerase sigma-70 factor (ECF subfamily)